MNFNILVVDDDDDDLFLLAERMKQCHEGITLTCASDGTEATRKLIEGCHPNLIMVDANMPKMGGYELLEWVMNSEEWRHIPVVVWTGAMSDSDIVRYYRAGANSLMFKGDALQDLDSFCHHWFKLVQLPKSAFSAHN